MIRDKYIVFPILISVWAIIFAHTIVPHHHHVKVEIECGDCHSHEDANTEYSEMHDSSHECNDHACYFNVDFITQLSVDTIFLVNNESSFLNNLPLVVTDCFSFAESIVINKFPKTNYLRGPPLIS